MAAQTVLPAQWLIEWDHSKRGPVDVVNDLAVDVVTPWLFPFADDDLLDPVHFEHLTDSLADEYDVVYTWCRLERPNFPENEYQRRPTDLCRETAHDGRCCFQSIRSGNWIPASAAIRTDLWRRLDGYRQPGWTEHEDWDFWTRALDVGARFRCVPEVTWTYRMHDQWQHRSG